MYRILLIQKSGVSDLAKGGIDSLLLTTHTYMFQYVMKWLTYAHIFAYVGYN